MTIKWLNGAWYWSENVFAVLYFVLSQTFLKALTITASFILLIKLITLNHRLIAMLLLFYRS